VQRAPEKAEQGMMPVQAAHSGYYEACFAFHAGGSCQAEQAIFSRNP
jgi:hypothetical protein